MVAHWGAMMKRRQDQEFQAIGGDKAQRLRKHKGGHRSCKGP